MLFILSFISGGLMCYGLNMITTTLIKLLFNIYIDNFDSMINIINDIRLSIGKEKISEFKNIKDCKYDAKNKYIYYFSLSTGISIFITKTLYFPEANSSNYISIITLILFSLVLNLWFINKIYNKLDYCRDRLKEEIINCDDIVSTRYLSGTINKETYYDIIKIFNDLFSLNNFNNKKIMLRLYYFKSFGCSVLGITIYQFIHEMIKILGG